MTFVFNSLWFREEGQVVVLVAVVVVIFAVFSSFQKLRHEQSVAILKSNRDVRDRKISFGSGKRRNGHFENLERDVPAASG